MAKPLPHKPMIKSWSPAPSEVSRIWQEEGARGGGNTVMLGVACPTARTGGWTDRVPLADGTVYASCLLLRSPKDLLDKDVYTISCISASFPRTVQESGISRMHLWMPGEAGQSPDASKWGSDLGQKGVPPFWMSAASDLAALLGVLVLFFGSSVGCLFNINTLLWLCFVDSVVDSHFVFFAFLRCWVGQHLIQPQVSDLIPEGWQPTRLYHLKHKTHLI